MWDNFQLHYILFLERVRAGPLSLSGPPIPLSRMKKKNVFKCRDCHSHHNFCSFVYATLGTLPGEILPKLPSEVLQIKQLIALLSCRSKGLLENVMVQTCWCSWSREEGLLRQHQRPELLLQHAGLQCHQGAVLLHHWGGVGRWLWPDGVPHPGLG